MSLDEEDDLEEELDEVSPEDQKAAQEILSTETVEQQKVAREILGLIQTREVQTKKVFHYRFRPVSKMQTTQGVNMVLGGKEKSGKTHLTATAAQYEGTKQIPAGYPTFLIGTHHGILQVVAKNPIFNELIYEPDPSDVYFQDHITEERFPLMKLNVVEIEGDSFKYNDDPIQLVQQVDENIAVASKILRERKRGTIAIDSWTDYQAGTNSLLRMALGKGSIKDPDPKSSIPPHYWGARNDKMDTTTKRMLSSPGHMMLLANEVKAYEFGSGDSTGTTLKCSERTFFLVDLIAKISFDKTAGVRFCKLIDSRFDYNLVEEDKRILENPTFKDIVENWYYQKIDDVRAKEAKLGRDAVTQQVMKDKMVTALKDEQPEVISDEIEPKKRRKVTL